MNRSSASSAPLKIGVLISGSGTNLQAIIDAIEQENLAAEVVMVLSSRPDAYGLKRAADAGIPTVSLNRDVYADRAVADAAIVTTFKQAGAEYLIMAGYMRIIGPIVLNEYPNRVLNVHPALLPAFPGAHAIDDAWQAGVKVTGVTVHFANALYDQGPIIAQRAVPIHEDDTREALEARIHEVEHELYPWVIARLAAGDISIDPEGKVHIAHA